MIDLASIITTGGVILFYKTLCQIKEDVLGKVTDSLQAQKNTIQIGTMKVQWIMLNELGLVFIIAYQELFYIPYIEVLLQMFKDQYLKVYNQAFKQQGIYKSIPPFEEEFQQVMNKWQSYSDKKNEKTKELPLRQHNAGDTPSKQNEDEPDTSAQSPQSSGTLTKQEIIKLKLQKQNSTKSPPNETKSPKSPPQKQSVIMNNNKVSSSTLDYTKKVQGSGQSSGINQYLDEGEDDLLKQFIDDDESLSSDDEAAPKKTGIFAKFTGSLKNLTGNKQITEQDLAPVLDQFKTALMLKNAAEEIAQKLCDNIKQKLLTTKTKAFTSISKTVKECMRETITKILTPNRSIDIIAEALRNKEKGKPYVVVFIGVNGVGKSTNLAKVAYLYKSQGFSVMIAACDNFRAGAVEQVKKHGENLGIPVYDRGYKDEPPEIAYQAIREATIKKIDVVLVDTAGRMQHNEPLMRALSRIVTMNNPDLVVFIGEALVGNDGVDQLQNFNKALIVNSPKDNIREIDAIIVSKFDTVDEKVGAALSLTYSTGKPIIFVGVGQKYTHLKKLNVNTVVSALLQ